VTSGNGPAVTSLSSVLDPRKNETLDVVTSKHVLQNHVSILAKSLIISFQYNIETVYFFYSNPVLSCYMN